MKSNILKFIFGISIACALWSCKNGDIDFPDFEEGTTVYFPYQYPVRTIVLGDDEYDTTLDKAHKCQIKATFGGSYNGSNGSVTVAVDNTLCDNLFFEDGVTPVKAMPESYYKLSTTTLAFNGTFNGTTEVQLTDAFFADPDAVKNTYVIPLVMTSQTGFTKILTGSLNEGANGSRTDETIWDVKPMDYVLYCVKFQNKYSGYWLTHGTTSTDDIEKGQPVEVRSLSLSDCSYTVSYQDGDQIYEADLKLSFDGSNNCTISSLTDGATASGTGSWGDNTEIKAWGNKDRDGMELNYTVDFGGGKTFSTHEKMVWQRSGVTIEEFAPVYLK
ncbi:MAG: DUF1735 domain-containing protein [Prevotella sp.]|nr:DUF1735 domain-containing protein [Prevotella sp.]